MNKACFKQFSIGACICAMATWTASSTHAQSDSPADKTGSTRTSVMKPSASDPSQQKLASTAEKVLSKEAGRIKAVEISDTPSTSYTDLQFVVGCMNQNYAYNQTIAQHLDVDALLLARVDLEDNHAVLTLEYSDTKDSSQSKGKSEKIEDWKSKAGILAIEHAVMPMLEEYVWRNTKKRATNTEKRRNCPDLSKTMLRSPFPGSPAALPCSEWDCSRLE